MKFIHTDTDIDICIYREKHSTIHGFTHLLGSWSILPTDKGGTAAPEINLRTTSHTPAPVSLPSSCGEGEIDVLPSPFLPCSFNGTAMLSHLAQNLLSPSTIQSCPLLFYTLVF